MLNIVTPLIVFLVLLTYYRPLSHSGGMVTDRDAMEINFLYEGLSQPKQSIPQPVYESIRLSPNTPNANAQVYNVLMHSTDQISLDSPQENYSKLQGVTKPTSEKENNVHSD